MKANLEVMRTEIPDYLASRGLVMFRAAEPVRERTSVDWDAERFPDYQAFIATAEALGVKLILYRDLEFRDEMVEEAIEDLEESELGYEDRREYERRLREFRNYGGFTCELELSYDHAGVTYTFALATEWFEEFDSLAAEVEAMIEESGDQENPPMGGFFSRN
jgi:hypothetical protein